MNGREKITREERRRIILAVLRGGATQAEMVRGYGLDKSHVSRLVSEARSTPLANLYAAQERLKEAEAEVDFRLEVLGLTKGEKG